MVTPASETITVMVTAMRKSNVRVYIEKFCGLPTENAKSWIDSYTLQAIDLKYNDNGKVAKVFPFMRGAAAAWYRANISKFTDFNAFTTAF